MMFHKAPLGARSNTMTSKIAAALRCTALGRIKLSRAALLTALVATVLVLAGACVTAPVTTEAGPDVRLEVVEWARLAQNAHNIQPWRGGLYRGDPPPMTLYVGAEKPPPGTDPPARQVTISMGNFLAVLEARAAQLGYAADIDLFPKGEYDLSTIGELPVAEITLQAAGSQAAEDETVARYPRAAEPDAITTPTVKYRLRPADLPSGMAERVADYSRPDIRFSLISDPEEVTWLNEISAEAFSLEMRTPATLMETYDLMRVNRRERREQPYGLSLTANFPARSLWFIDLVQSIAPQDPEAFGRTGTRIFTQALEDVTHYVMIVSSDNSRATQVETGMALQALWMEFHAAGHVLLPSSQALQEYPEMSALYDHIHTRYAGEGETIQMLLAVARPRPGRHLFGPRLPVADVVEVPD